VGKQTCAVIVPTFSLALKRELEKQPQRKRRESSTKKGMHEQGELEEGTQSWQD